MGIRIHKMMGYGLTDVVENDHRLNHSSPIFDYELDDSKHLDRYFAWLKEWDKFDVAMAMTELTGNIQSCFEWGTVDGGLPNVLCVRPMAWTDWYRYDDTLDYTEQTYSKRGQRDTVKVFKHALFPHDSYMDSRTGEPKSTGVDIYIWLRARNNGRENDVSTLDELARLGGFESNADAEAHCVPLVPDYVRWLCEFTELFADPATVLQLRPMIYTWWS